MTLTRALTTATATTTATLALAATVVAAAQVAPAHGGVGPAPLSWPTAPSAASPSTGGPWAREGPSTAGEFSLAADSHPGVSSRSAADVHRGRWLWPLQPRPLVMRSFEAPATRYGRGHRGIDLAARPGDAVRSVDAGVVTHAGSLAGRGTITLLHDAGLRSTYEPVSATVRVGDLVDRGAPVGVVEPVLGHCGAASCLHLGALRGDAYLDPLPLLMGRVILLPVPASW